MRNASWCVGCYWEMGEKGECCLLFVKRREMAKTWSFSRD